MIFKTGVYRLDLDSACAGQTLRTTKDIRDKQRRRYKR